MECLAKQLGETWVVEDPYLVAVQVRGHPLGETHTGQSAKHQNAVIAGSTPAIWSACRSVRSVDPI